jgi:chromosomal replication initiator protein
MFGHMHGRINHLCCMKSKESVWDNCLEVIKKNINASSYTTWFVPIKPAALENDVLTIQVPNKFFYEWIEEHYVGLLKKAIHQELGPLGRLEYQILVEDHRKITRPGEALPGEAQFSAEKIKNPFVIPGIRKERIDPQLNINYTFDTYIEGDHNKLARSAGLAIARNAGRSAFNPLFIFGSTGLGKTHLAQAIGNEVLANNKEKAVLYVSSENFTNQFIHSIKNNAAEDFVNFYQNVDVLIIDDIHVLANRHKTQDIFFHIFNQLHQNGKQIIITSDRPAKELSGMEERLISRFKWGLNADLIKPDLETRMAILESKMHREGISFPSEVVEFICLHCEDNIRELEGVLISLIAQSTLNNREVNLSLAKEVVQKLVNRAEREVTVDNIKKAVAEYFDIPLEKLHGKTRKRAVVIARQLSMYLAKNLTNSSFKTIGDKFGGRDHSTVIYSCNTVQNLMDTDEQIRHAVADLEKKLSLSVTA